MKKIITAALLLLSGFFSTSSVLAQDARFAQSYSNPLRLNPAIMGANRDIKFAMNYRSQWSFIDKGYKTYSFTAMYPIILKDELGKVDIGISAMSDKAGAFKTTDLALAIDYSKEISPNNNLCLSLMGGYVQKSLDITNETFDSQYTQGSFNAANPNNEAIINNKVSHPDLGFGFMWFFNPNRTQSRVNAYVGLAGFHLNQPNQTFIEGDGKVPMRFSYQAGMKIFGENKVDFSPAIRVNNQNGNVEAAAGLYLNYNFNESLRFVIGGWYRVHDANAFVIGLDQSNFSLGYSYDMIYSGLNDERRNVGAHEITLTIKLAKGKKGKKSSSGETETDDKKSLDAHSSPFSSF
jgi:type IX secretion system PorP/SprF family membrane protein